MVATEGLLYSPSHRKLPAKSYSPSLPRGNNNRLLAFSLFPVPLLPLPPPLLPQLQLQPLPFTTTSTTSTTTLHDYHQPLAMTTVAATSDFYIFPDGEYLRVGGTRVPRVGALNIGNEKPAVVWSNLLTFLTPPTHNPYL